MPAVPEADEGKRHNHHALHRQIDRKLTLIQIETTYKELGISSKPKRDEVEEEVVEEDLS